MLIGVTFKILDMPPARPSMKNSGGQGALGSVIYWGLAMHAPRFWCTPETCGLTSLWSPKNPIELCVKCCCIVLSRYANTEMSS